MGYALCFLFRKYIIENNIETIITSGPHSLHLIGLELKRKLDLTWFADFSEIHGLLLAIIKLCDYQITPLKA
jgi:hypothetical protein